MSEDKNGRRRATTERRIRLPDGTWGVYMGETGGMKPRRRPTRPENAGSDRSGASVQKTARKAASQATPPSRRGIISRYSLTPEERDEAEKKKAEIRAKRSIAGSGKTAEEKTEEIPFLQRVVEKLRMWRLGISVNVELIIKGLVVCALILVFSMLQITVFSRVRPLGAIPDLMLPLVIAIGISEGERWGGVSGLAAAFLIECLGSAGVTLLPLLYVPCGFAAGILGTYYLRDSFVIRAIFTVASGILRAVFTIIYVNITFSGVGVSLMFSKIVIPEFISTAVFAFLPHLVAWLSFRPFHKTRADRID